MIAHAVRLLAAQLILLTLAATSARGEEPAASTDVEHLELGDRYKVVVRRDNVEQRYSGELVQLTDEWLVLRHVSEGRSEHGVPVLSKIPYANRMFRNVGVGRQTSDCWIPRSAATVVGRFLVNDNSDFERLSADHPAWDRAQHVQFSADGQIGNRFGCVTLDGDTIRYFDFTSRDVSVPWPVLGHLPGVGHVFTTYEVELQEVEREVPLKNVMSVLVSAGATWKPQENTELSSTE
jgi:hypothetical protein